ncbi:hypothetical protein EI555_012573, partial [Monodon monoceros]
GFPYGHLHASNVMLEGDACRLLDLENSLLGLPSFYRSYFSQFRKINTLESVDVHCFGHLLSVSVASIPLPGTYAICLRVKSFDTVLISPQTVVAKRCQTFHHQ